MERTLKKIYQNLSMFGINPINTFRSLRAIPYFFRNLSKYRFMHKCQGERFPARMRDFYYESSDRFKTSAGTATGHYFWQDLWAARYLYDKKVKTHIDVGSRMDGFVAHILPFCHVTYIDYRPVGQPVPNLTPVCGSLLELPFASNSVHSLSCLHVIEHVGLGRYGDPVDPHGYVKAAKELVRILRGGGWLLIGTPVGKERLCFDAHRIFDPKTIENIFSGLNLEEFSLVNDQGRLIEKADFKKACQCDYGCGLFVFRKE